MQIRQEINIVNWNDFTMTERDMVEVVQLDTTQYNGTVTYYFEFVGSNTDTISDLTVTLRRKGTSTDDASVVVPKGGDSNVSGLFRSSSFTPPNGQTQYVVHLPSAGGSGGYVWARVARIVILQNAPFLTKTETQIELGSNAGTSATTATVINDPKYWKYNAANWDGTLTVYFEAVAYSPTTKSAAHVILQVSDGTGDNFTGWSNVTGADLSFTNLSSTPTRTRSSAIILTADRNYRVAIYSPTSKSAMGIYNAKIVIDQASGIPINSGTKYYFQINRTGAGNDTNYYYANQSSNAEYAGGGGYQKTSGLWGTESSTSDLMFKVYSDATTIDQQQPNATAGVDHIHGDGVTWNAAGQSFTANATYVLHHIDLSLINFNNASDNLIVTVYTGSIEGTLIGTSNALAGSSLPTSGTTFSSLTFPPPITKLELQYLLIGPQTLYSHSFQYALTKWDTAEWSGTTNTYYAAYDSSNDGTLEALLCTSEADGGAEVTNSHVYSVDNEAPVQITMPASCNLDCMASVTNDAFYAAKVLVYCTIDAVGGGGGGTIKKIAGVAWANVKKLASTVKASVKKAAGASSA